MRSYVPKSPYVLGWATGFACMSAVMLTAFYASAQVPTAPPAATPKPTPTPPPPPPGKMCVVNPKTPANPKIKPAFYRGKWYFMCCESCRYQFSRKPYKWANKKL